MPVSELISFEEVQYGTEGLTCFRCTFRKKGLTVWDTSDASEGSDITIGKFPTSVEACDALRTWLSDHKAVAAKPFMIMLWEVKVSPFLRTYSTTVGNHAAGDTVVDADGNPRVYSSVMVPCETHIVDGKEVPKNRAQVEAQAVKNRKYFIEKGRYLEVNGSDAYVPDESAEAFEAEKAAQLEAAAKAAASAPSAPRFDPLTGNPIVGPAQ